MSKTDGLEKDLLAGRVRGAFDALNAAGIPYVVLRGYQPISALAQSVDIDIYIPKAEFTKAANALQSAGWSRRRFQVGRYPHTFFDSWDFNGGFVKSFDVVTELCFGDDLCTLLNPRAVVNSAVIEQGVRVPSPWIAALLLALHIAKDKQTMSKANAARVRMLAAHCGETLDQRQLLAQQYGKEAVDFVDLFLRIEPVEGVDLRVLMMHSAKLHILSRRPLLAAYDSARRRWNQFRRPVVRVGVFGVDGAGKTTIIENIQNSPSTVRVYSAYLGNNKFRTLPAIWLNRRLSEEKQRSDSSIKFRILANLRTLWWPFELLVRMAIAEHRSEVVFYDRYPLGQDDTLPTTRWGRLMAAYSRLMHKLLPSPDVVFLLDGEDSVLWARKKEFSFDVHKSVQERYRKFVFSAGYPISVVRTDGAVEDSLEEIKKVMVANVRVHKKLYAI